MALGLAGEATWVAAGALVNGIEVVSKCSWVMINIKMHVGQWHVT